MLRPWIPAISWAALIFALYSAPGSDFPDLDGWSFLRIDKIAHFVIFSIFFVVLKVAFLKEGKVRKVWLKVSVVAWIYGFSLEVIQGAVFVDRYFEWSDLLANFLGVLLGDVIFRFIYGRIGMA